MLLLDIFSKSTSNLENAPFLIFPITFELDDKILKFSCFGILITIELAKFEPIFAIEKVTEFNVDDFCEISKSVSPPT